MSKDDGKVRIDTQALAQQLIDTAGMSHLKPSLFDLTPEVVEKLLKPGGQMEFYEEYPETVVRGGHKFSITKAWWGGDIISTCLYLHIPIDDSLHKILYPSEQK